MTDQELLDIEILLPYQADWSKDNSKVKVWEKSRRIGASYGEACETVLEAAKSKPEGGQDTFYLSYNKEMTQQFINDCAMWAKVLNKAASEVEEVLLEHEDRDITVYRLTMASGFQIWGLPSEPRSLRSKQGRVIIDEAAFVEDLKALLKAAMALTMWGGVVRIMSTHNGEDNPFNELIKEIKDGKKNYSLHRTNIQNALDLGLYKRICLVSGKEWSQEAEREWLDELLDDYGDGAAEELYCIPTKGGTRYISRSLVESCMDKEIPVLTYECTDDFTFESDFVRERKTNDWLEDNLGHILRNLPNEPGFIGEDFARSGDLSEIAIFNEKENRHLKAACYIELRNVPFAQQFQIFCYAWDKHPRMYAASLDARGNGQMMAELAAQKYGPAYVNQVMISRAFYMEYMPKYKAKLEDREMTLPGSPDIVDDHRTVVLDKGVPTISERTSQGNDKSKKRHGDSVIAGVMANHAYENDESSHQSFKYEAVEASNPWRGGNSRGGWR